MRVTKISSEGLAFEAGPSWRALPFCAAWLAVIWLVDKNFAGERTFSYYWVALTFSLVGVLGFFGSLQCKKLSLDPELKKSSLAQKNFAWHSQRGILLAGPKSR